MDVPKYVLDRIEQRWASRLSREAAAWRHERSSNYATRVTDRAGRSVPVSVRRSSRSTDEPLHA